MHRRQILQTLFAGGVGCVLPTAGFALGRNSMFDVAELQIDKSLSRPNAWKRGLIGVTGSTSIEADLQPVQISPESVDLFAHPFTVLIGDDEFAPLSEIAIENLRRYLMYGGFLFIDDASGLRNSPFEQSVQRLCRRLFPNSPLINLASDHSMYRSFFLLEKPVGRYALSDVLKGIQLNTIFPLIYCPNDLSGALDMSDAGGFTYMPVPDGEYQRREALKLFINTVLYALTSNYKHDQVHVAELLRRGGL